MSQSSYTPLQLYYSITASAAPTSGNLLNGELAININDGKLFYKDSGGVVQVIASKAGNVNVASFSGGTTGLLPSSATTGAITLSGTLNVANGGTGLISLTANYIPYGNGTSAFQNSANLTFNGTTMTLGNAGVTARFQGDFSNATFASRTAFQTGTTNGTTGIYALPNGTSTAASWQATNAADPTNASKILIATNGSTDVQLVSGINGTGTYLPLALWNGGVGRFVIGTSGQFGVGPTATVSYGSSGQAFLSGGASAAPSWGTLSIGSGGSGQTTAQAAMNAFAGAVTSGSYLRGNGTNVVMSTIQAADVPTLNQNTSGTAAGLSATLAVSSGGTGLTTTPANGALDIGNGTGFTRTTLTQGTGITITNSAGGITIANSAPSSGGTVTSVTGTSPVSVANGTTTPAISLSSGYGDTLNPYASKTANYFLAAPNGSAGAPTFRAIVAADIPTLNQNTSGTAAGLSATLTVGSGGTGAATLTANNVLLGNGTSALQVVAPGTSGNVLTSNGTTWTSAAASGGGATLTATTTNTTYYIIGSTAVSGTMSTAYVSNTNAVSYNASTGTLTAVVLTASSDETLKTNWRALPVDYIERLAEVKHGTFDRIETGNTEDGVSGQSLQFLLPNSVFADEHGLLSVNYGGAALVSAIQLAQRVVEQDARIAKLEELVMQLLEK
jgi:hypothetical protein